MTPEEIAAIEAEKAERRAKYSALRNNLSQIIGDIENANSNINNLKNTILSGLKINGLNIEERNIQNSINSNNSAISSLSSARSSMESSMD